MRTGKYEGYIHLTVKLPVGLRDRIDELARKGDVKRNGWIVRVLAREARWEPQAHKRKGVPIRPSDFAEVG